MMAGPILTPALVYVFNKKNSRTPSKCTYNICVKKSYKRHCYVPIPSGQSRFNPGLSPL